MANIVTGFAGRVVSAVGAIGSFYTDMNPSTLSGAIDIVVVEDEKGNLSCSPFHVRFGKLKLLHASEKLVELTINGQITPFVMKLGEAGEAFFVIDTPEGAPSEYATSPIPQPTEFKTDGMEPLELGSNSAMVSAPSSPIPTGMLSSALTGTSPPLKSGITRSHERSLSASSSPMPNINIKENRAEHENILDKPSSGPLSDSAHPALSESIPVPGHNRAVTNIPGQTGTSPESETIRYLGSSPQDGWEWKWGEIPEKRDMSDTKGHHRLHMTDDYGNDLGSHNPLSKRISTPILRQSHQHPMSISEKVDQFLATLPEDLPAARPQSPPLPSTANMMTATDDVSIFTTDEQHYSKDVDSISTIVAGTTSTPQFKSTPASGGSPPQSPQSTLNGGAMPKFELSQCGPIKEFLLLSQEEAETAFSESVISYESFSNNPTLLHDPAIVVRIQGEYHTWATAVPILFSFAAFGKPLPSESLKKIESNQSEQSRYSFGITSWFSRSTSPTPPPKGPTGKLQQVTKAISTMNIKEAAAAGLIPPKSPLSAPSIGGPLPHLTGSTIVNINSNDSAKVGKVKHLYAKSLRLNSEQLKTLNLQYGRNTITFSVVTSLQGKAECAASIFLWKSDSKIVVSDIDGTITKSDALGHLFTMVGRDWTHKGVAPLYTNIHRNGYVFLYLSSRPIGQASSTREYLQKVAQDSYQLPQGPVIVAPDRLFRAFTREVILRKPEEFKIACLRDIRKLFGANNPFYAGFGNRITDALSYRSVDIPSSRIFTIDPSGEVKLELMTSFRSSYIKLVDTVDQMFPPLTRKLDSEYTDFSFWKSDIPKLDELELISSNAGSQSGGVGTSSPDKGGDPHKKPNNRLSIIDSDDEEDEEGDYYDDIEEDEEDLYDDQGEEEYEDGDGLYMDNRAKSSPEKVMKQSPSKPATTEMRTNLDAIHNSQNETSPQEADTPLTPGGPLKWTESEIFRNDQQKLDAMDASPFI